VLLTELPVPVAVAAAVGAQLRRSVTPIFEGDLLHPASAPTPAKGVEPELPILVTIELGIEAADGVDELSTHECRRADRVPIEQLEGIVGRHGHLALPEPEEARDPIREAETCVLVERRAQRIQRLREEPVIRVEDEQIRRVCESEADVAGDDHASAGLAVNAHASRKAIELGQCFRVRRSVIHDDHVGRAAILLEDTRDRLGQETPIVVIRDHNCYVVVATVPHGTTP
jgi:hypothetical protein